MTNATSRKWLGEKTLEFMNMIVSTKKRFVICITCSFSQPVRDFNFDQNFRC